LNLTNVENVLITNEETANKHGDDSNNDEEHNILTYIGVYVFT